MRINRVKWDIKAALALTSTVACFGLTFLLMFHPIPEQNKDVINMNLGLIYGGTILLVYGAYFSSSDPTKKNQSPPDGGVSIGSTGSINIDNKQETKPEPKPDA